MTLIEELASVHLTEACRLDPCLAIVEAGVADQDRLTDYDPAKSALRVRRGIRCDPLNPDRRHQPRQRRTRPPLQVGLPSRGLAAYPHREDHFG